MRVNDDFDWETYLAKFALPEKRDTRRFWNQVFGYLLFALCGLWLYVGLGLAGSEDPAVAVGPFLLSSGALWGATYLFRDADRH